MPIGIGQPEQPELNHRRRCERRRRARQRFPDEIPAGKGGIHLKLERRVAGVMKPQARHSACDAQSHRSLQDPGAQMRPLHPMPHDNEQARWKQRQRHPLPDVLEVTEEDELAAGPNRTRDEDHQDKVSEACECVSRVSIGRSRHRCRAYLISGR